MQLKTKRLTLCPTGTQYLQTAHEYSSDLENTTYMRYLPNESIEETAEFLKRMEAEWQKKGQTFYEFAIIRNEKHIGSIGLEWVADASAVMPEELLENHSNIHIQEHTTMEFGWILHKNYWGQGIVTEAAKALLDFGNKELGARHFIAHCDSENQGSYKVMEKLGMRRTACYGGRRNKSSVEERTEFRYELFL